MDHENLGSQMKN